jgi:hypothetical protein
MLRARGARGALSIVSAFALALALALAPELARAASSGNIDLQLDEAAARDFAQRAGVDPNTVRDRLQGEIDRLFQVSRIEDYLRLVGDSNAFTTKGIGVDYATTLKFVMVGAAVNLAANAESALTPEDLQSKPPIAALTTNFTLMGGLNLGILGLRPVTIYGNYFKGGTSLGEEFSGDLANWGLHGQLKLFAPEGESLLIGWGGIAITSGVESSQTSLRLGKKFKRDFPFGNVAGTTVNVGADSASTLNVDLSTYSVPLEVTTSLRLLLVTVYGGAGFDWQLGGTSKMGIDVDTALAGKILGQEVNLGRAHVTASSEVAPSPGRFRGIVGAQVNVAIVKLFTQATFTPNPFLASIAFGAKIAY